MSLVVVTAILIVLALAAGVGAIGVIGRDGHRARDADANYDTRHPPV